MARAQAALSKENIPLYLVRKYARKTREYKRAYDEGITGLALAKKQLKKYKK